MFFLNGIVIGYEDWDESSYGEEEESEDCAFAVDE